MILNEKLKKGLHEQEENYIKLIDELKNEANEARPILLDLEYKLQKIDIRSEKNSPYFKDFMEMIFDLQDLVLFPDEEVLTKLKEIGVSNSVTKWFVNIEDIIHEIERLENIKGLYIFKHSYLFFIHSHLSTSIIISFINEYTKRYKYKNEEVNVLYLSVLNLFRRREYNERKGIIGKMNYSERLINLRFDFLMKTIEDKKSFRVSLLKILKGESQFLQQGLLFHNDGISKNRVYEEFYPLIKLVEKNKVLYSQEEFNELNDDRYNSNYSEYKKARVKKILT